MYCPSCGAPNAETSRFCQKCGQSLPAAKAAPPTPVATHPAPSKPRSRTPILIGLAVIVLVGLGMAAVVVLRQTPADSSQNNALNAAAQVTATQRPPALTPTLKPSATASATPLPSATPEPTVTNTPAPTATPTCPAIIGVFAQTWEVVKGSIGCAATKAIAGLIVEENFEGGRMFWREPIDVGQALVLYRDGTSQIVKHSSYVEGSPEFSCLDANTPAQCPPTPKRGFGLIWCDVTGVRSRLGKALDCERAFQGRMQQFEHGFMLLADNGAIYVVYNDGHWERK